MLLRTYVHYAYRLFVNITYRGHCINMYLLKLVHYMPLLLSSRCLVFFNNITTSLSIRHSFLFLRSDIHTLQLYFNFTPPLIAGVTLVNILD